MKTTPNAQLRARDVAPAAEQLTLAPIVPVKAKSFSIDERFKRFISANPQVYSAFVFFAREYLARGHGRVGAKAVWERLRWEYGVRTAHDAGDALLNNDYVSRIARLAAAREPDLRCAFAFRALRDAA